MELKEMIKVMEHFADGGKVKFKRKDINITTWSDAEFPNWNWNDFEYLIKEQKQKVTIEKWLLKDASNGEYFIYDSSRVDLYLKETISIEKVKLIKSYEVEL